MSNLPPAVTSGFQQSSIILPQIGLPCIERSVVSSMGEPSDGAVPADTAPAGDHESVQGAWMWLDIWYGSLTRFQALTQKMRTLVSKFAPW